MPKYRHALPQMTGKICLSDGGLETSLIFHQNVPLPHFASFVLLDDAQGHEKLRNYYIPFLEIARQHGTGFILDTPTWRANPDWGAKLGYDLPALRRVNAEAVALMAGLREDYDSPSTPCVICVAIGPRGDGYAASAMDATEAEAYHSFQIAAAAESGADMVSAYTLTGTAEAVGVAWAAASCGMPCVISFTLETDGRLLTGKTLREAIEEVDDATGGSVAYFMVNCAHPTHFDGIFDGRSWCSRIFGVRPNASAKSHAELDESETLDEGDPADLGRRCRSLKEALPSLRILGGCCGTDHRHVAAICSACL